MTARKMDRWWTILIAFLIAAGMVLLVILAMDASPTDGSATIKPAAPPGHGAARSRLFLMRTDDTLVVAT